MKTPDVIKKGLECCKEDECFGDRENCPYTADPKLCVGVMCADALALIQQLDAENDRLKDDVCREYNIQDELKERIHQLEAERDALYEEVRRCFYCIHVAGVLGECDQHCESCNADCPCKECDHYNKFEWRGVQKEE